METPERLLDFPTMILEDSIGQIKKSTETILALDAMDREGRENNRPLEQKQVWKVGSTFESFFAEPHAQNVLTSYHRSKFRKNRHRRNNRRYQFNHNK